MESEAEARRARLLALRNQAASAASGKSGIVTDDPGFAKAPVPQQPFAAAAMPQQRAPVGFYSSMHLPAPSLTAGPKPPLFQSNQGAASSNQWNHMISSPAPPPPYGGGGGILPNAMAQRSLPHFTPGNSTGQFFQHQQQTPPGMSQQAPQSGHLGRGSGPPFGGHSGAGPRGGRGGGSFGARGGGRGGHHDGGGRGGGGCYYKSSFMEDPWAALVAANQSKPPKLPRTM